MRRLKKTIRNLLLLAVLFPLFMSLNGLYLSPVKALHSSEKDLHYGPTEIVHSFDHGNMRYFLGRYGNHITFAPIKRSLGIFWKYGGGFGVENYSDRPVSTGYRNDGNHWMLYGIRNDSRIAWIELEIEGSDGELKKIKQDKFYEDLFYVIWEIESEKTFESSRVESNITAYDAGGQIIYKVLF